LFVLVEHELLVGLVVVELVVELLLLFVQKSHPVVLEQGPVGYLFPQERDDVSLP